MEPEKSVYLKEFMALIDEAQGQLSEVCKEGMLEAYELPELMQVVVDMLLHILIEFYSKVVHCADEGRFQMKRDLRFVLERLRSERWLTDADLGRLEMRYVGFLENFFNSDLKSVANYIVAQFHELSFFLTKIFLLVNRTESRSKKELVLTKDQQHNLSKMTQVLHKMIINASKDEDVLERNVLASFMYVPGPSLELTLMTSILFGE